MGAACCAAKLMGEHDRVAASRFSPPRQSRIITGSLIPPRTRLIFDTVKRALESCAEPYFSKDHLLAAPYVSHPKLIENSFAAMLSAIEVYNKPQMTYRDEVTVMLVVNAWELALKAALRKKGFSVFYRKERGETYRSLTLDDALGRVNAKGLWPKTVAGPALVANIKALSEYRNRATHLYNNPA